MSDTAAKRVRRAEMATPDHLPACAKCGDLNEVGDDRCRGCNGRLYPPGVTAPRMVAVEQPPTDPMQQWWKDRLTDDEIQAVGGWVA